MAVALEFINLLIPIENINKVYPGGFEKFKKDHNESIGRRLWYDKYLLRDGAMSPMDMKLLVDEWEKLGLKVTDNENDDVKWRDICVVDTLSGTTLKCDWIEFNHVENAVFKKGTDPGEIINRQNTRGFDELSWNHKEWSMKFKEASKLKSWVRELRADVFESTVNIVKNGGYQLIQRDCNIENRSAEINTVFYESPPNVILNVNKAETKIAVINADCLDIARLITLAGFEPVVLNMANRQNPGGGVFGGAGAQEENIFSRSNLYVSLFQFVDYCSQYGIQRNADYSYPLNRNTGGIYSHGITVFRSTEANGYSLIGNPYKLSFVTVPAINKPDLTLIKGEYRLVSSMIEPSKQKIRTILRIALNNGHDSIVLSAFGCGAFGNPPKHIAELFKLVFDEEEFHKKLKLIVFAIIDDHNARKAHNPEGNIQPFIEEFE